MADLVLCDGGEGAYRKGVWVISLRGLHRGRGRGEELGPKDASLDSRVSGWFIVLSGRAQYWETCGTSAMSPTGGLPEAQRVRGVKVGLRPRSLSFPNGDTEASDGRASVTRGTGQTVYGECCSAICIPPSGTTWVGGCATGEEVSTDVVDITGEGICSQLG